MKYRKKPVVVEAFKWTGDHNQVEDPTWIVAAMKRGEVEISEDPGTIYTRLRIKTLEGTMEALPGDYIIKGVQGEIYPCKPDIFEATYDIVE